nr:S41 family peptidase [uncultured Arsenicibacter sp.]
MLTNFSLRHGWVLGLMAISTWVVTGCKKADDAVTPAPDPALAENGLVDNWILSNMRDLYYWNDKLPAKPDTTLAPADFFDSILYKYDATLRPDGDRFSWIEDDSQSLEAELSGQSKTTGMEFNLYLRSSGSDAVIAQVLYVLPNSPAAKAGLVRGDIISKVNGTSLTKTNYYALLFQQTSFTFGLAKVSNSTLVDMDDTRSVTAETFQEDPVFMDSVYTVNGKKVGYLVYNLFTQAPYGSTGTQYDNEVDAVFAGFKAQGVTELILDLRYNGGGDERSAINLASLIGKNVDNTKEFFHEEYNSQVTQYLKSQYGSSVFVNNFTNKAQSIGANLNRVFVLTTDWTASASELIINGLKPYMSVVTIGSTTYGKNVGSTTISDDTGKIKWGLQPIIVKAYNSLGQSDYTGGFAPTVEIEEPITLKPLGDVNEDLLSTALQQISGTGSGRFGIRNNNPLTVIGSSVQRKAGGSNFFVHLKSLPIKSL